MREREWEEVKLYDYIRYSRTWYILLIILRFVEAITLLNCEYNNLSCFYNSWFVGRKKLYKKLILQCYQSRQHPHSTRARRFINVGCGDVNWRGEKAVVVVVVAVPSSSCAPFTRRENKWCRGKCRRTCRDVTKTLFVRPDFSSTRDDSTRMCYATHETLVNII